MRAFVVSVPVGEVDLASDRLWQLGVRAIEERTDRDDHDRVELWTAVGDEPSAIERAVAVVGERWPTRTAEIVDASAETWRDFATPTWVDDDLVVVPAWQEGPVGDGVTSLAIEPGGAFGLGDHPTTLLSLRAARRCLDRSDHRVAGVLDVGCGTGVIAVTAAVLTGARVRAVDLASAAVEATLDNAARNGVADRVVVDTSPLGELDGAYDLVVANILAPTLIELAPDLRRVTATDGSLVVSGILADRHAHVLAALAPMVLERTDTLDGWAAVTLHHPAPGASPHPQR